MFAEPSPAPAGTRLAALALAVSTTRRGATRYAAVYSAGGDAVEAFDGSVATAGDAPRLRLLAAGVPVLTTSPRAASALLERAGLATPTTLWDVLDLATLLVPECPADSLDHAAAFFGLQREAAGLEAEARLLLALFQVLLAVLDGVDTPTLLHVNRLAAGLDWPLRGLFLEVERARTRSALEAPGGALATGAPLGSWIARDVPPPRRRAGAEPEPCPLDLDLDDLSARLAPDSPLAQALPSFEARSEQVAMARVVAETLQSGGQSLVEAGTGVGKSVAYLLPAALAAVDGGWRVVVSTATTTLQDQLFAKDLPVVQASLGSDRPIRATVLKGRGNYLCLRRWQTCLQATDLDPDDRSLLIKTLFWLPRTRSGDRAELRLTPGEERAWGRLSAVTEACTPARCAYHRVGVCFLARARRAAEESHIVITNHALLLTDLVTRSRVLPEYQALVVDEAHHLEDEATQQLGWRVGERELLSRLDRLWSPGGPSAASGIVPECLAVLGGRAPADLLPDLARGEAAVHLLRATLRAFFDGLADALDDPDLARGGDERTLRLSAGVRAGSRWEALEALWQDAVGHLGGVEGLIQEMQRRLAAVAGSAPPPRPRAGDAAAGPGGPGDLARDLGAELDAHLDAWRDLRKRLSLAVHTPDPGTVYWVGGGGRFRGAWLSAAPLDVSNLLRERLFAASAATVLVSATLAIGGSFDYVKRRLGLDEARAVALGSPFDYARAALLYVPNDLPDPTQPGYQEVFEDVLLDVLGRLGGRTLVLFTSRAHLRATYAALREPLARQGITLLGQGINEGSRTRLLDAFRRGSRVALFGTNAFWEGIDVVGQALSCVVVARLPFAVPTDPIYAARAEHFEDPFGDYAVPQAVLRLKQGFGRLIRSRADRGAVVVLDRRLVTRLYGGVFVRSLPPCTVSQGSAARAGVAVEAWLGDGESEATEPTSAPRQLALAPG